MLRTKVLCWLLLKYLQFLPILAYSFLGLFERTITVEQLMLDGNLLQSLNICLSFNHISRMTVTGNKIQYLLAEDFVHKTDDLELQDNEIRRINRNTFEYIRFSLKYLDLGYNHITSINGSIRDLPRLEELCLDYNSIQVKICSFKILLLP